MNVIHNFEKKDGKWICRWCGLETDKVPAPPDADAPACALGIHVADSISASDKLGG